LKKPTPTWGGDLSALDYDSYTYYIKPSEKKGGTWEEIPDNIKKTFDRLGVPEAERKFLAGLGAQYESEMVYHSIREDLAKKGVIFLDTETGLREYPNFSENILQNSFQSRTTSLPLLTPPAGREEVLSMFQKGLILIFLYRLISG